MDYVKDLVDKQSNIITNTLPSLIVSESLSAVMVHRL